MNQKCSRCGRIGDEKNGRIIDGEWYGPVCYQKVLIYGKGNKKMEVKT